MLCVKWQRLQLFAVTTLIAIFAVGIGDVCGIGRPQSDSSSLLCRKEGTPCTLYISSSCANASDANKGDDPLAPLATLTAVMTGLPQGLQPGDRVLLRRGDTWQLQPTGVVWTSCTAPIGEPCPPRCLCNREKSSLRVVVSQWDDSNSIISENNERRHRQGVVKARPLLRGVSQVGSAAFTLIDAQYIEISSVAFSNAEVGLNLVYSNVSATYTDVSVIDCDFHDIQWANFTSNITVIYGAGNAIQLFNPHAENCQVPNKFCPTPTLVNLLVRNSMFERVDMAFSSRVGRTGLPLGVRDGVSTVSAQFHGNLFLNCSFNTVMVDGAHGMDVQHNVFLKGQPRILFGYGTTDLIIAYADASTVVANNDFVLRGEHAGDPDGCPIDLETDSHNLRLGPNNMYYRPVAASVNVFGHTFAGGKPETSKNLTIFGSVIVEAGCLQGFPPYHVGSSDVGAIAFDLPNGSGLITQNTIVRCDNPKVPLWGGATSDTDGFAFTDNNIVNSTVGMGLIVAFPTVTLGHSANTTNATFIATTTTTNINTNININANTTNTTVSHDVVTTSSTWAGVTAVCATNGAVIRFTLDGSRPTETSDVWPPANTPPPQQRTAVLVRAFKPGMIASATNGLVLNPINNE